MKKLFFIFLLPTVLFAQNSKFGISVGYSETYMGNIYSGTDDLSRLKKTPANSNENINFGVNYASIGSNFAKRVFLKHGLEVIFPLGFHNTKSVNTHKTAYYINNSVGIRAVKKEKIILQFQLENNFLLSSNAVKFGDFSKLNRSFWSIGTGIQPFPSKSNFVLKYDFSFVPVSQLNSEALLNQIYFSTIGLGYSF